MLKIERSIQLHLKVFDLFVTVFWTFGGGNIVLSCVCVVIDLYYDVNLFEDIKISRCYNANAVIYVFLKYFLCAFESIQMRTIELFYAIQG